MTARRLVLVAALAAVYFAAGNFGRSFVRIVGLDRATFQASYEGFISRVVPEDREASNAIVRQALAARARRKPTTRRSVPGDR